MRFAAGEVLNVLAHTEMIKHNNNKAGGEWQSNAVETQDLNRETS